MSDLVCKQCGDGYILRQECEPTDYCDLCAQTMLAQLTAENAELRTQLDAWHTSFGTTQLTHAVSEMEQVKSHLEKEEARCSSKNAMLQKVFEMRCDDDVDWKDLSAAELLEAMDDHDKVWLRKTLDDAKASKSNRLSPDDVMVLRRENADLRAKLEKALDENNSLNLDCQHSESERIQAEAKCAEMRDYLQYVHDWTVASGNGVGEGLIHALSPDCGKSILEKVHRLREALNLIRNKFIVYSGVNPMAEQMADIAKQALSETGGEK